MMEEFHYCVQCGQPLVQKIPEGDTHERAVCESCGHIHYSNPKNICGCILEWQGKILLCKRAIEPRYGYWTFPAGFMENKETAAAGAAREAEEEACAQSADMTLFGLYNLPRISQVYLLYRGTLVDGQASPGEESLETGLYEESEIPWDDLAFPVVTEGLQRYFEDRRQNHFKVHTGTLAWHPDRGTLLSDYQSIG